MKTRNIKEQLIARIQALSGLHQAELELQISDIVDSLLSRSVSVRQRFSDEPSCPVPAYDHKTDGDYSAFLAAHNCD